MYLLAILILTVAIAAIAFAYLWWDESRRPRLTILMYHRFVTEHEYTMRRGAERAFSLPVERFEQQLRHLHEAGYHAATIDEVRDFVLGTRSLPQPAVAITIDDGCRCAATQAQPMLRRFGLRATLFVTTDRTAFVFDSGSDHGRLTDEELRRLDPQVIDVQAHGVTHRPLRGLSDDELSAELNGSRESLERILSRPVRYMAVPGNWYDTRVLRFAREAGYEAVCVSDAGSNRPGLDPMRMRRINVEGQTDLRAFARLLTPYGAAQRRFVSTCRRLPGRLLGPRLWLPIRNAMRTILPERVFSFVVLRRLLVAAPVALIICLALWWWWKH
jgi:peptidoglycan/xylan/chitin deacetylase (PgdA/CDA1 family)